MAQQGHLVDKGAYCQAWWPESDPLDPHIGETEPTPESCSQTSIYALTLMLTCTYTLKVIKM